MDAQRALKSHTPSMVDPLVCNSLVSDFKYACLFSCMVSHTIAVLIIQWLSKRQHEVHMSSMRFFRIHVRMLLEVMTREPKLKIPSQPGKGFVSGSTNELRTDAPFFDLLCPSLPNFISDATDGFGHDRGYHLQTVFKSLSLALTTLQGAVFSFRRELCRFEADYMPIAQICHLLRFFSSELVLMIESPFQSAFASRRSHRS